MLGRRHLANVFHHTFSHGPLAEVQATQEVRLYCGLQPLILAGWHVFSLLLLENNIAPLQQRLGVRVALALHIEEEEVLA